jgi:hypothetical protein
MRAWAPKTTPSGTPEFISLGFEPLMASQIRIVESWNDGAVVGVDVRVNNGVWIQVYTKPARASTKSIFVLNGTMWLLAVVIVVVQWLKAIQC